MPALIRAAGESISRMPRIGLPLPCLIMVAAFSASAAEPLVREPNTTLALPQDPPVYGYVAEPALDSIWFINPVVITSPPGETNRLFVAEQLGVVAVVPDLSAPSRRIFLSITPRIVGGEAPDERGLLGLAFHPGYATNGHFYVYYSTITNGVLHQRLSRFTVSADDPNVADPDSEFMLFSQRDDASNHNGGDLHFGPDGYLYVSLGDGGGANDSLNNSQVIDRDFHSGIFRIDVDRRPGSLPPNPHPSVFPDAYAVPPDNPFVGATEFNGRPVDPDRVRTEFWAVGLRNPWRMSFDPQTGHLWAGDVGQSAREEINLITRGGNYGWAYREGTLPGPKAGQAPPGFTSEPPIVELPRAQASSITGGIVYRGTRLAQLSGAYIFGDYISGNIWALRGALSGNPVTEHIANRRSIAAFGRDPRNGDILMADQARDILVRIDYSPDFEGTPLPETLADTGAFADLGSLTPNPGIVPYEVIVPYWADGAVGRRWFSVPDVERRIEFHPEEPFQFPAGSVWIKHFEIEMTNGVPESRRRLETQFLVRNPEGVYGVSYRWTDPPTNAVIVPEGGLDETLLIQDGGIVRTQVWHYAGRNECLQCHNAAAGWILGFNARQLNRPVPTDDGPADQLPRLVAAGYFTNAPSVLHALRTLAPTDHEQTSVEWRVRSWLDANCAHCHRPGGAGFGDWDARAVIPLSETRIVDGRLRDEEGNPGNRLVKPGDVELSMIHSRVARTGPGHMPPLGGTLPDPDGLSLLERWITNGLASWRSFEVWQQEHFEDPDAPEASRDGDFDGDGADNWLEYLTGTDPADPLARWTLGFERRQDAVLLSFPHLAHRGFIVEWNAAIEGDGPWQPLDHPANAFQVPAEPFTAELSDAISEEARFYRVRILEP